MVSSLAPNKKTRLLILPLQSLFYFAVSALLVLLVLGLLDRVILPQLELREDIGSKILHEDDGRIFNFIMQRNVANSANPVWRSGSFPVLEDKQGKKRILVVGDSFVWGDGQINLNDLWWRQLQFELERRGYRNVEVIGAGMCGASTRIELSWARQLLAKYKPDLIIMGYVTNDPDEGSSISGEGYVKQLKTVKDGQFDQALSLFSSAFPHLAYQLKDLRHKKLADRLSGPEHGYSYLDWEEKILEGKNFEVYKETVHQLGDFARSCGIPFFCVTLPLPMGGHLPNYQPVEKAFAESGVRFVNLLPAMLDWVKRTYPAAASSNGASGVKLTVNPINGHPGLAADYFYAGQTADLLEKDFPDSLGQKTEALLPERQNAQVNDWVPPVLGVTQPKPNIFALYYPSAEENFLRMPLGRPYVQLNLVWPVKLKEIHLLGKDLASCRLTVRGQEPGRLAETVAIHELGEKKGKTCVFKLPALTWRAGIDEIMITADFNGDNRQLLVELVPG